MANCFMSALVECGIAEWPGFQRRLVFVEYSRLHGILTGGNPFQEQINRYYQSSDEAEDTASRALTLAHTPVVAVELSHYALHACWEGSSTFLVMQDGTLWLRDRSVFSSLVLLTHVQLDEHLAWYLSTK
jgi:hypothetical protein